MAPKDSFRTVLLHLFVLLGVLSTGASIAAEARTVTASARRASVAAALVSLSSKTVDRAALEQITKGALADDDSFEALDRAWEEEPVTFGPGDAAKSACRPNTAPANHAAKAPV